jgi:hypothetical protein
MEQPGGRLLDYGWMVAIRRLSRNGRTLSEAPGVKMVGGEIGPWPPGALDRAV